MGRHFPCWICGSKTKVVPLKTEESAILTKTNAATISSTSQTRFHRPPSLSRGQLEKLTENTCIYNYPDNKLNCFEVVSLSNCSSLATISLGSIQNLDSNDEQNAEREGTVNNRLQDESIDYDREWQSSLPNLGKVIKTGQIEKNPRAFSSMGRLAMNLLKSKDSDNVTASIHSSQYSGNGAEKPTNKNGLLRTSLDEPVENPTNKKEKAQLFDRNHYYLTNSCELPDSSTSESQTEGNVLKMKTKECPHGILLSTEHRGESEHVVRCVRCERPDSCGGRALKGLIQFRRNDKKRRKEMEARRNERLQIERDRRRQQEKDVQEALRKFAEAEMGMHQE